MFSIPKMVGTNADIDFYQIVTIQEQFHLKRYTFYYIPTRIRISRG